jgi:hypothetical protein
MPKTPAKQGNHTGKLTDEVDSHRVHLSCALMFLVDCYVVIVAWGPPHATTYLIFLLFCRLICHPQTMIWRPPHTFRCNCASPIMIPPLLTPTFGWLSCFTSKRRPPKAETPSLSLFFDGSHFGAPSSKGTSRGD